LGFYILKKIEKRLGGKNIVEFWQQIPKYNYHFCYINCNKNYLINCVDQLISGKPTTMLTSQQKFIIHPDNQPCSLTSYASSSVSNESEIIKNEIEDYLQTSYPKNKHLFWVFKILLSHDMINSSLFFKMLPNLHVADFCTFLNNKFDKPEKVNHDMIKFCKYLQKNSIKLPRITVKNPIAQKLLC
jgi:hypothetical protein